MDRTSRMDQRVIDGCFENGVRLHLPRREDMLHRVGFQLLGVEVPAAYGGPELSFFNLVLIVEEVSKVDPAVGTLVAVHNTLIVPLLTKYGTEEQKQKYLSRMHKDWVSMEVLHEGEPKRVFRLPRSVSRSRAADRTHSH